MLCASVEVACGVCWQSDPGNQNRRPTVLQLDGVWENYRAVRAGSRLWSPEVIFETTPWICPALSSDAPPLERAWDLTPLETWV